MFYIIQGFDGADGAAIRQTHIDAHKTHIAQARVRTLISGPLLAPDEQTTIGSFFLVEAETRSQVEKFHAEDPFRKAGLWDRVTIHAFHKRIDAR